MQYQWKCAQSFNSKLYVAIVVSISPGAISSASKPASPQNQPHQSYSGSYPCIPLRSTIRIMRANKIRTYLLCRASVIMWPKKQRNKQNINITHQTDFPGIRLCTMIHVCQINHGCTSIHGYAWLPWLSLFSTNIYELNEYLGAPYQHPCFR